MTSLQKYCRSEFKPEKFSAVQFFFDVDLSSYTYFGSGGTAECLLQFSSAAQLEIIADQLAQKGIPFLPLGFGSNILIADHYLKDKVVLLAAKNLYTYGDQAGDQPSQKTNVQRITFSAGTFLPKAQNICHDLHLKGFEFATGIPGSIGGAIKTNAGTKLGEISEVLHSLTVLEKGQYKTLAKEELNLAYRSSNLTQDQFILEATFALEKVSAAEIKELKKQTKAYLHYRRATQPLSEPSFGSCFKNPHPLPHSAKIANDSHSAPIPYTAAQYIEACGLKGLGMGDATISEKHANFILNKGRATTQDALRLIDKIKTEVYRQFKIELELEVQVLA